MIAEDIRTRTDQALSAKGVPTAGLSVDGRDVLLSGATGSPIVSDRAREIATGVEGVRAVTVIYSTATDVAADTVAAPPIASELSSIRKSQRKLNVLLQSGGIEFDDSRATLTVRGRKTLDQIAPILAAAPSLACAINGYTDSSGGAKGNQRLSEARAAATKNYLVSKGIAPVRLSTAGLGDANPIASNKTESGKKKNRRIEFVLKEKS